MVPLKFTIKCCQPCCQYFTVKYYKIYRIFLKVRVLMQAVNHNHTYCQQSYKGKCEYFQSIE